MDQLQRASGEREEEETRPVTRLIIKSGPNLELALDVIKHLELKLKQTLTEDEKLQWAKELSNTSEEKLFKVANEFNGPYIANIWKFIEDVAVVPVSTPKYLEEPAEPKTKFGVEISNHINEMRKIVFEPKSLKEQEPEKYQREREEWLKKKRTLEVQSYRKLMVKFPNMGIQAILFLGFQLKGLNFLYLRP